MGTSENKIVHQIIKLLMEVGITIDGSAPVCTTHAFPAVKFENRTRQEGDIQRPYAMSITDIQRNKGAYDASKLY